MPSGEFLDVSAARVALAHFGFFRQRELSLSDEDLLEQCSRLGSPVASSRHPALVRDIRPQPITSANRNTLSSRYGLGPFPFHTDGAHWWTPPRFLVLYCVSPGEGHRPTHLADFARANLTPMEGRILCDDIWKVVGVRSPFLCSVGRASKGSIAIRYDAACMEPAGVAGESSQVLADIIRRAARDEIRWSRGDLLVIDNSRMLHARGEPSCPDLGRWHKRILIGEPACPSRF